MTRGANVRQVLVQVQVSKLGVLLQKQDISAQRSALNTFVGFQAIFCQDHGCDMCDRSLDESVLQLSDGSRDTGPAVSDKYQNNSLSPSVSLEVCCQW